MMRDVNKDNVIKNRLGGNNGFTLIELMIVLIVVAVLLTVALPLYTDYLVRGNRAAAQAHLMKMAQQQQLFFNDTRSFATTLAELNMEDTPPRVASNYDLALAAADPNDPVGFSITATPKAGTNQVDDGVLFIDNTGDKTRAGEPW